jgi:hypothetical protein
VGQGNPVQGQLMGGKKFRRDFQHRDKQTTVLNTHPTIHHLHPDPEPAKKWNQKEKKKRGKRS